MRHLSAKRQLLHLLHQCSRYQHQRTLHRSSQGRRRHHFHKTIKGDDPLRQQQQQQPSRHHLRFCRRRHLPLRRLKHRLGDLPSRKPLAHRKRHTLPHRQKLLHRQQDVGATGHRRQHHKHRPLIERRHQSRHQSRRLQNQARLSMRRHGNGLTLGWRSRERCRHQPDHPKLMHP